MTSKRATKLTYNKRVKFITGGCVFLIYTKGMVMSTSLENFNINIIKKYQKKNLQVIFLLYM